MLTADQLREREGKLFSTDAAAALGVSKYRTPYQLWLEKTGRTETPGEGVELPDFIVIGAMMEPVIAQLYETKTGRALIPYKVTEMHDTIPWMGSHFDYRGSDRLVEIKNFGVTRRKEFGETGSPDVPPDVKVQVIHEMVVSNVPRCDVAVLFGGNSFDIFTVTLDPADEAELIERESEFMLYVSNEVMPPPISAEDIKLRFPGDTVANVVANAAIMDAVSQRRICDERIDSLSELRESLDVQIKAYMAEAGLLLDTNGDALASWRKSKDTTVFDAKRFAARHPRVYAKYLKARAGARPFLIKEEK